jgi:hypothetical protein
MNNNENFIILFILFFSSHPAEDVFIMHLCASHYHIIEMARFLCVLGEMVRWIRCFFNDDGDLWRSIRRLRCGDGGCVPTQVNLFSHPRQRQQQSALMNSPRGEEKKAHKN